MYKIGTIIFTNNKGASIVSKLIRFFTRSRFTHVMFAMGNAGGKDSVLSAEELITPLPTQKYFESDKVEYIVYEWVDIPEDFLEKVVGDIYYDLAGTKYGKLQLLWHLYRWFAEMFNIDVRKQGNWFPAGNICSEVSSILMKRVGEHYNKSLFRKLDEWNINNLNPYDLYRIVQLYSSQFKLVDKRGFESQPI